jgi:hypothetical protein
LKNGIENRTDVLENKKSKAICANRTGAELEFMEKTWHIVGYI